MASQALINTSGRGQTRNNSVTILSYDLWQRRFNSDQESSTSLNITMFQLQSGHHARGFYYPDHTDLWVPVGLNPETAYWYLEPIGRLREGITAADAERKNGTLWNDIAQRRFRWAGPISVDGETARATALEGSNATSGSARRRVGLLIACANIANLLARAMMRSRQIVRECLGASPAESSD
jgi:hypothetical protein